MKKSKIFLIHVSFWLCNLLLLLLILAALCKGELISNEEALEFVSIAAGVIAAPGLTAFYGFYFFLFPRYFKKRKVSQSILYGILIVAVAVVMGLIALYLLMGFDLSCYKQSNYVAYPIMSFVALVYGSIAIVIRVFINWYEDLKIKEALQEKNHKMEMALVKAQLDPHFLFNTINNIDVLILKDAQKASDYLNKLSDIMRFMLFETKTDEIALSQEIEYIEKYIALQKIRTSNANYVQYSLKGEANQRQIAPMIFIPFIENAFKHSSNKKIENAIKVEITIDDEQVGLRCENIYDPHRKNRDENNGLGNELIQKRLNLIYPDRHELEIVQGKDMYTVNLTIRHA